MGNIFKTNNQINAAIVVVGDLNRSPRMLNHAKAIATLVKNINQVSIIGYNGGDLRQDIATDKRIVPYYLGLEKVNKYLQAFPRFMFIFVSLIKIIIQIFILTHLLFKIPKSKFLILQNPPSIPALLICLIVCFIRRTEFVLDWHNYGYTILKVNKRNRVICYFAYLYEKILGRFASVNLCVSKAMKEDLQGIGIKNIIELPDRAMPHVFIKDRLKGSEFLNLFMKYKTILKVYDYVEPDLLSSLNLKWKTQRPLIFISSTSWTPDEDFDFLLQGMIKTDEKLLQSKIENKEILLIITGRGPMRDEFLNKVNDAKLTYFKVKSIWLDSDDYPQILRACDLGICMHYSSSGLDLPMKVVDMFSAGLPTLAIEYKTITELVDNKNNGLLFKSQEDLSELMFSIAHEFFTNGNSKRLDFMRSNLKSSFNTTWIDQWNDKLYNILIDNKRKSL